MSRRWSMIKAIIRDAGRGIVVLYGGFVRTLGKERARRRLGGGRDA